MRRRTLLGLPAFAALGACGAAAPIGRGSPDVSGTTTHRYGTHPSQLAELTLPAGKPRGVVVVVHGGFWKQAYDLSLGRPLAASLAAEGWAAWNLEYRRVGGGGGTPETFDDVAAGIDLLAEVGGLDTSTVITLGHSAGGHLATWAAARPEPVVPVTGVVAQAGVLDLVLAHELGLGSGAVEAFLGHPPGPADRALDPFRQLPLGVPVRCIHGRADADVPLELSERYVAAAAATGADAALTRVDGDHYVLIDPASEAWAQTLGLLADLG
ncbi:alpha/beta hydrolase family protein [Nocardioides coralli]|uniref:alpha/beta hydrolase family protein n=1 Tax=Nocardioides coralli TaxID=2872154 RepID=UPI001CA4008F|nr:alpha/beta hydrolase [Nocardioides coralli]QZY28849.1 prolyl oligopeptidase family serine peptidase [Nocardioides coralli]